MAEFQVLHEVGEFNLQQPDTKISEQEQQLLNKNDQASKEDHSDANRK